MSKKTDWKSVKGEPGVYIRDYGDVQIYKLQGSYKGKRIIDALGEMTIEEVRMIRETLKYNRKNDIPPFSYADMLQGEAEKAVATQVIERKQQRIIIKEEEKRLNNTVELFWENKYWPNRLTLRRSERETASIDGRWRHYLKPHFGEYPLEDIEKKHFADFVIFMREQEKPKSETTIHKCIADMRTMWNFAIDEEIVSKVFPGKAVGKEVFSEIDNEKKCFLEPEEAKLLAKTVFERRLNSRLDHDVYCYVVLGLCLGLRAGDIHKINGQVVERHIIDRTKNKRARFVHFNFGPVRAMLDERLSLYPPADPLEPLFLTNSSNSKGRQRTEVPGRYFDIIKELGFNETPKRVGNKLETIDFHALRHTFATFAAMNGIDHVTLKKLMGHKKLEMTLRYIELADAHQAENLERAMPALFPMQAEEITE